MSLRLCRLAGGVDKQGERKCRCKETIQRADQEPPSQLQQGSEARAERRRYHDCQGWPQALTTRRLGT